MSNNSIGKVHYLMYDAKIRCQVLATLFFCLLVDPLGALATDPLPEVLEVQRLMVQSPAEAPRYRHQLWLVALDYEAKGDLASAIAVLEELERQVQGRVAAYPLRLGYLYYRQERYENALRYYQQADAITPTPDAAQGMLNAAMALQEWPESARAGELLLKRAPDDYLTMQRLGFIYGQLEQFPEAFAAYDRVLHVFPNDQEALAGKATILLRQGARTEARALFEGMVEKDPTSLLGQQGLLNARDFKYALTQYVTKIWYSPRSLRTNGLELNVAPSINYQDRFIFTPAFTYTDIAFGNYGNTRQNAVNLGLLAYVTPQYAVNFHVAQVYNNTYSGTSTKDGKIIFAELQHLGPIFIGLSGAYSDYNADSHLGVSQATLRLGGAVTPWLSVESKGWYHYSSGQRAPVGASFGGRETVAFEQKIALSPASLPGFTGAVTGWWGRKQLPIEADGAQVWNLTDRLMGGYKTDLSYTFDEGATIFFQIGTVKARPGDTNNNPATPGIAYQQYMTTFGYSTPLPY